MDLAQLDQKSRLRLLDGTTITLNLHYSGNTTHYAQQISAAQNNVSPYLHEKLCEQAGNACRAFSSIRTEIPWKALAVASPDFADLVPDTIYKRDFEPDTFYCNFDLGQMLPGYAMHILTWYCSALRSGFREGFVPSVDTTRSGFLAQVLRPKGDIQMSVSDCTPFSTAPGLQQDFPVVGPSVHEHDKFFWLYSYVTMRKLGMHQFADSLGDAILGDLVEKHQLVDEFGQLDFILENLDENDPSFRSVAERYVVLENLG